MPLAYAVYVGDMETVRMMLAAYGDGAGLDVTLKEGEHQGIALEGLTPLCLARKYVEVFEAYPDIVQKHKEIIALLESPNDVAFDFEALLGS